MDNPNTPAVIVLSGGLDSSVALAISLERGISVTEAVTFDYGQRAAKQEVRAAAQVAGYYQVAHRVIELNWMGALGGGLLNRNANLPEPSEQELENTDSCLASAKAVWVPNRNGVFLEIAAGIAESRAAKAVLVGFNLEEAATFPDNSQDYLSAINEALSFSTANGVQIESPTAGLNKSEIVRMGVDLDFPFEHLWSCYQDLEKMCGRCESCMRLKRALASHEVDLNAYFEN